MEQFIVKHYSDDERPIIKGNGFDGLEIGTSREDAEEFIRFVNGLIESKDVLTVLNGLSGRKVRQAFMTVEEEAYTRGYNDKAMEVVRMSGEYRSK